MFLWVSIEKSSTHTANTQAIPLSGKIRLMLVNYFCRKSQSPQENP